jgi:hypothetical protein
MSSKMARNIKDEHFALQIVEIREGFGEAARKMRDFIRNLFPELDTPLKLNPRPICGPKRLCSISVSNHLSQFSLCICTVALCHLTKAFCDPIPAE